MTAKIQKIYHDIEQIIIQNYDEDDLDQILPGSISIQDVIYQILVECCRYAYLVNAEKHPWSYYIDQDGLELDVTRKEMKRTLSNVNDHFENQQKVVLANSGLDIDMPEHKLIREKGKYAAYNVTRFQYWELNNIHDMPLVWAIVKNRISSSKKISVDTFIDYAEDYDRRISKYINEARRSKEDMVFSSLVVFTLETTYSFDFFYKLAREMERQNVKEIPDLIFRLAATTGVFLKFPTMLNESQPHLINEQDCMIKYPMIIQRELLIPNMVSLPKNIIVDLAFDCLVQANILANSVQSHFTLDKAGKLSMREWFVKNTAIDDWASLFESYDVFRTFEPNKEWTDTRIKYVRNFYDPKSNKS